MFGKYKRWWGAIVNARGHLNATVSTVHSRQASPYGHMRAHTCTSSTTYVYTPTPQQPSRPSTPRCLVSLYIHRYTPVHLPSHMYTHLNATAITPSFHSCVALSVSPYSWPMVTALGFRIRVCTLLNSTPSIPVLEYWCFSSQ